MSQNIVSPAELSPGMKVTVLEWLPDQIDNPFSALMGGGEASNPFSSEPNPASNKKITLGTRTEYCGEVLSVLAIDLPFIAITQDKFEGMPFQVPIKLDTRRLKLKEVSKEYVAAMRPPDLSGSMGGTLGKLIAELRKVNEEQGLGKNPSGPNGLF